MGFKTLLNYTLVKQEVYTKKFKNKKMKRIQLFYDDLYQYYYYRLLNKESDPEVMPMAIISLNQTSIIVVIFIVLKNIFSFNLNTNRITISVIIIYVLVLIYNFLVYQIFKRKNRIINRNRKLPKSFGLAALISLILSIWLPILMIYLFDLINKT